MVGHWYSLVRMQRRRGITKSTDPSPEQILCQILLVDLLVVTLVGDFVLRVACDDSRREQSAST